MAKTKLSLGDFLTNLRNYLRENFRDLPTEDIDGVLMVNDLMTLYSVLSGLGFHGKSSFFLIVDLFTDLWDGNSYPEVFVPADHPPSAAPNAANDEDDDDEDDEDGRHLYHNPTERDDDKVTAVRNTHQATIVERLPTEESDDLTAWRLITYDDAEGIPHWELHSAVYEVRADEPPRSNCEPSYTRALTNWTSVDEGIGIPEDLDNEVNRFVNAGL